MRETATAVGTRVGCFFEFITATAKDNPTGMMGFRARKCLARGFYTVDLRQDPHIWRYIDKFLFLFLFVMCSYIRRIYLFMSGRVYLFRGEP